MKKSFSAFFFLTVLLFLPVFSTGESSFNEIISVSEVNLVPSPLISSEDKGEFILVEKSKQRLHIYDNDRKKSSTFIVTTGKNQGDKMYLGDKKTPEGVYFFTDLIEEKELFPEYGVMALVTDYPNPMDIFMQKNGSGIWLHATNQPERPLTPNDTRGCVVAVNEDILNVAKHIDLEMTPFVIVDELEYVPAVQLESDRQKVFTFLGDWESSWEGKNLDVYMSAYSSRFRSGKKDWEGWRRYKDGLNSRYDYINVDMKGMKVVRSKDYFVVTFVQHYQSDTFKDKGIKRLYIVEEDEGLKIIGEEWRRIPTESPKLVADTYLQRIAMRHKSGETIQSDDAVAPQDMKPSDKAL